VASLSVIRQPDPKQVGPVRPADVIALCKDETLIGRNPPECGIDLQLPSFKVTRQHARITRAAGAYWIEDLQSRNGTYLNQAPLLGRPRLSDGDQIRIGDYVLLFREDANPPPSGWPAWSGSSGTRPGGWTTGPPGTCCTTCITGSSSRPCCRSAGRGWRSGWRTPSSSWPRATRRPSGRCCGSCGPQSRASSRPRTWKERPNPALHPTRGGSTVKLTHRFCGRRGRVNFAIARARVT
jgi:hypothetical protein